MAEESLESSPNPSSADARPLETLRGGKRRVTDEEIAVLLEKSGGFKSRVAKQVGLSVSAVCKRVQRSEMLQEACRNVEETVLDIAESGLIAAAQRGEAWAICFILKCKGRKRGWIERQDIAFNMGGESPPPFILGTIPVASRQPIAALGAIEAEAVETAMDSVTPAPLPPPPPENPQKQPSNAPQTPEKEDAPQKEGTRQNAQNGASAQNGARRRPQTPSEAAAMRREREAEEKAKREKQST